MTITRENVQSIQRHVAVLAFDFYDGLREKLIPKLEQFVRFLPEERGAFEADGYPDQIPAEWMAVFPQWREWLGDRVAQIAETKSLFLTKKEVELTTDVLIQSLGSQRILGILAEFSKQALATYPHELINQAADLIASNPPIYDGQDLFDTEHEDPDGDPASNLITLVAADRVDGPNLPKESEARAELDRVKKTLVTNAMHRARYYIEGMYPNLVVFVRNDWDAAVFDQINRKNFVGDNETEANPWKGRLVIVRSVGSTAQTHYDVVWAEPGMPKPVFMIEALQPKPMRFNPDISLDSYNQQIDFGTEATYYVGPGMWQTSVRVEYSIGG